MRDRYGRAAACFWAAGAFAIAVLLPTAGTAQTEPPWLPLNMVGLAATEDNDVAREALDRIEAGWRIGYAVMLLELAEFHRPPPPRRVPTDPFGQDRRDPFAGDSPLLIEPRSPIRDRLIDFLSRQTGQRLDHDFERWNQWIWSQPYDPHPDYAAFKGLLYANIDSRMPEFFPPDVRALIRLDEVRSGGVPINGIPPLFYPEHIPAADADYLRDGHVVFGISINGDARAFPKRILAWHELAWDRIGDVELTIVYCTLCGTVIPYESVIDGELRRLGTSGLLYRSNKLMFDDESRSLWSTLEGKPVIGPLAGTDLTLTPRAVVTTTWGEWRREHPETTVLSLDTGHDRDYSEGAAYRDYFGTDRLMFAVPGDDNRLKNKDEVLIMRVEPEAGGATVPMAIAADFLRRRPVFQTEVAGRQIVVVTSERGANRAYDAGDRQFTEGREDGTIVDETGTRWIASEDALTSESSTQDPRPRLPAQRAFWFAWHAQFPDTVLIK